MIITFCFLKLNVKWKNFDIKYQMEFIVNIRKIPKKNTIYLRYHIFRKFLYIIIIRRPWAQEHKSAFSSKLIKLLWCRSFYLLLCCNDFVEYSQIWDGVCRNERSLLFRAASMTVVAVLIHRSCRFSPNRFILSLQNSSELGKAASEREIYPNDVGLNYIFIFGAWG